MLSAFALFTTTIRFHWNLEDTLQLILVSYETSVFMSLGPLIFFFKIYQQNCMYFWLFIGTNVIYYPYNATA